MNSLELCQKSSEFTVFIKSTDDFIYSTDFCFHDWPSAFDDDFLQVVEPTIAMTIIAVYYFQLSATTEMSTTIFYHAFNEKSRHAALH